MRSEYAHRSLTGKVIASHSVSVVEKHIKLSHLLALTGTKIKGSRILRDTFPILPDRLINPGRFFQIAKNFFAGENATGRAKLHLGLPGGRAPVNQPLRTKPDFVFFSTAAREENECNRNEHPAKQHA